MVLNPPHQLLFRQKNRSIEEKREEQGVALTGLREVRAWVCTTCLICHVPRHVCMRSPAKENTRKANSWHYKAETVSASLLENFTRRSYEAHSSVGSPAFHQPTDQDQRKPGDETRTRLPTYHGVCQATSLQGIFFSLAEASRVSTRVIVTDNVTGERSKIAP